MDARRSAMGVSRFLRGSADAKAGPAQRVAWRIAGLALAAAWWLLARLSPERASAVSAAIFRAIGPFLHKMPNVRSNLQIAFPERSPGEIEALARDVWGNFGAVLAEFAHFEKLCGSEAESRIETAVRGRIRALTEPDRPAIFVAAHLANFHLSALAAGRILGQPLTVLYATEHNPWVDRRIAERRALLGCRLLPREGSVRQLIRELEAGRSLGLIVDTRRPGGEMVPFFGVEAETAVIPARLAIRYGCELIPVRVERLAPARFRVSLYDPIEPPDRGASEREQARAMTLCLHRHFESWIRERPGEWWCTSRRWPKEAVLPVRTASEAPFPAPPGSTAPTS
jgi:KDO2-lipid IV(A) lauroyltransferase